VGAPESSNYSKLVGAKAYREKRCNPEPNNHQQSCLVPLHVLSSAAPSLPSSRPAPVVRAAGTHGGGRTRVGACRQRGVRSGPAQLRDVSAKQWARPQAGRRRSSAVLWSTCTPPTPSIPHSAGIRVVPVTDWMAPHSFA